VSHCIVEGDGTRLGLGFRVLRETRHGVLSRLLFSSAQAPVPKHHSLRHKPYLGLVSRHIQWTDAENGIAVAKEAGFPAILWMVELLGIDHRKWKSEMSQETFIGFLKCDFGFYNDMWRETMATPPPPAVSVKAGSGSNLAAS
jgi:hypothetical protein